MSSHFSSATKRARKTSSPPNNARISQQPDSPQKAMMNNMRKPQRLSFCVGMTAMLLIYQIMTLTLPSIRRVAMVTTSASDGAALAKGMANFTFAVDPKDIEIKESSEDPSEDHTQANSNEALANAEAMKLKASIRGGNPLGDLHHGESRQNLDESPNKSIRKKSTLIFVVAEQMHPKLWPAKPKQQSVDQGAKSVSDEDKKEENKDSPSHECTPIKHLKYRWDRYSEQVGVPLTKLFKPSKRLLIGMYSGFDKYARMLDVTAHVSKAYAQRWQHDLVVLQGTHLILPTVDRNCTPMGRRVTFNKVALLEYALQHTDQYDQLLLMDTDAMMYDLDFDVTSLLPTNDTMLAAHPVIHRGNETGDKWDVNAGVMLWNLHHPRTEPTVRKWLTFSRDALSTVGPGVGDQRQLHWALRNESEHIQTLVNDEFAYGHGTVIRHYIRTKGHKGWTDPNILETRLEAMKDAQNEVCNRYDATVCDSVPKVNYESG